MLGILVCLCFCAEDVPAAPDAIPANIRDYFQRADATRAELSKEYETKILDLEIAIQGAANSTAKAKLRQRLNATEKLLDTLKRSKVTAFLPTPGELDDVGCIRPCTVEAVIDDHTAVLLLRNPTSMIVVTRTETKGLKAGQSTNSPDTWRVVSMASEDAKVLRVVGKDPYCVVEPLKKGEIEKHRTRFEEEKKAAIGKPTQ